MVYTITKKKPVRLFSLINDQVYVVEVTHYIPAISAKTSGPMEDAVEGSPAEFEYTIFDDTGLKKLDIEVSPDEDARLFAEFEVYLASVKWIKEF